MSSFLSPALRTVAIALTSASITLLGLLVASPAAATDDPSWSWPLAPRPPVTGPFDPPDEVWGAGHRGVDLLGQVGDPVLTVQAGEVSFAGVLAGRGVVVVDHGDLRSTYEPVSAAVEIGDLVLAGQVVGVLQSVQSHCLPEACLHLGARRGDTYVDPLTLLGGREVRLKPLDGLRRPRCC